VFVRGHLRKYARLLGLPEQELLDAYQAREGESTTELMHPVLRETVPVSRRRRRVSLSLVFMVVLVLGLLAAASWWWFQMRAMDGVTIGGSSIPSAGSSVALSLGESPSADSPAPVTAESPAGSREVEAESVPLEAVEEPSVPVADAQEQSVTARQSDNAEQAAEIQIQPEPPAVQINIVFDFVEDSWAEVHDGNQKRVLYGLFRAGTRRELTISAPASVYLGHVEGVSISVDGKSFEVPARRRVGNTSRFTIEPPR
jgi:cytoskeleton protein RodZ